MLGMLGSYRMLGMLGSYRMLGMLGTYCMLGMLGMLGMCIVHIRTYVHLFYSSIST